MDMREVSITKLENAGRFFCRPVWSEGDALQYLDYLASLNTYFEKKKKDVTAFLPAVGQYCAVHVAVGDSSHELWYRAKIMCMFQSSAGIIAKLLLVDEGEMVCTPKARMRRLPEKFENYPHQVMSCVLADIIPVTIGAAMDLMMSLKKARHWDNSATKFVEDLVKGATSTVEIKAVDEDNVYHVILYLQKDDSLINVNDLLVKQKYATLKTIDDLTLSQQSILVEKKGVTKKIKPTESIDICQNNEKSLTKTIEYLKEQGNLEEKLNRANLHAANVISMEKEKRRQEEQLRQRANKERDELLRLLNDFDETPTSSSPKPESSGNSELSDMESTPVPPMTSHKRVKPGLSPSQVLAETLRAGKACEDLTGGMRSSRSSPSPILSETLRGGKVCEELIGGIHKPEGLYETPKSSKHVSFALQKEILEPCSVKSAKSPSEKFGFNEPTSSPEKEYDDNMPKNVDASYILKALSIGNRSASPKNKYSDDDILVYGKLKRESFTSIDQLNLPLPLKSCLVDMNASNPTTFQKHLWSSMIGFRHVVGIPDAGTKSVTRVLGYMLPILCDIFDEEGSYSTMGKGNGPFVVICVAGWAEAQEVFDICERIIKYYKKLIRVDVRYGGMDNVEARNIRLINGCDLLITTVPSLNKAVECDYINLNRLCHLVFDNAHILVEKFTEDIKIFMRSYGQALKKSKLTSNQIIAVSMKWSYGIHSLMNSYLNDPLVIIANSIEAALFVKVPIIPEICNLSERLEHLIGFLETDAVDEDTIIFTNSAKGADNLHEGLKTYSIITNVCTEFTSPVDMRDIKLSWQSGCQKSNNNFMIMSDHAVVKAKIKNATCIVHYDFPQKKSHFGNRLGCLLNTIRENENKEKPKGLLCQVFITEHQNGVRYCTGLVKLLRRSGQHIPELLQSMAVSSRELKEEQKQFNEICPRLKLFGECSFIEDCGERHTIFKDKDLLGLCPSTGFIKVLILDVISASSFWGRIVEHRLPYDPDGSAYDTTVYLKLMTDMQLHYSDSTNRRQCCNVEKYDICVWNTVEYGYQRVRVEKIVEREYERPKTVEVFGIDNGFRLIARFSRLIICDEKFKKVPPQAIEVIACCVKPVEEGNSWTVEASCQMERTVKDKTLEGRVQFSLQNTIWVDPLVEKKLMSGIQQKVYSLDVGRDLLVWGFAEKNLQHVEHLRRLLFDVQGHPIEIRGNKQNLPISMIEHDSAYLNDDDYEDVYVSSVVDPSLFYVQRAENLDVIKTLDDKIDATMSVKKLSSELVIETFPVGYICVAQFSGDKKWYRCQILGVSKDQTKYDVFFVDHGDREWIGKSKVAPGWADILLKPFQAIECSFKNITSIDSEWSDEDGDVLWDLIESKLLAVKVLSISASTYINDTLSYEIELFDTTGNQTQNISHELVYMGHAQGSLQCMQEMFPHATISQSDKVVKDEYDRCPDLCLEIHQNKDTDYTIEMANKLKSILLSAPVGSDRILETGSIESVCKLLALSKKTNIQEILVSTILELVLKDERYTEKIEDHDGIKALCEILKKTSSETIKNHVVKIIQIAANDMWSLHVLLHMNFLAELCRILDSSDNFELLISTLDAIAHFCKESESNRTAVRHADGIEALCHILKKSTDVKVIEKCSFALKIILSSDRNQDKIREIGGLQILASVYNRKMNEAAFKNILETIQICIKDNESNREYLHKINAHENLQRCAQSPKKYNLMIRMLLNDLMRRLAPAPVGDFIALSEKEIDPSFEIQSDSMIEDDYISEQMPPKTLWAQTKKKVTISIQLRGVHFEETNITCNRVYFRTILNHVEYILDIELYSSVIEEDKKVYVTGSEVFITLLKENLGEIWPRLLNSSLKVTYIGIDFDRWVDEFQDSEPEFDTSDGIIRFGPGLPKPPPCTSYEGEVIGVEDPQYISSEEFSTSDEDELFGNRGEYHADYFNI